MGTIADLAAQVYREYITDGVPASGVHKPRKDEIRSIFDAVEGALSVLTLGGVAGVTKATRALLYADLAHDADTVALVYADATDSFNDFYIKTGASGAGAWTPTTILQDAISGAAQPFVAAAEAAATAAQAAADRARADLATAYGITLGSDGDAAVWDLRFWRTEAFQDEAGTIPAQENQDVGRILNRLGDATWDLRFPGAGKPTLVVEDGVPLLRYAANEGLYTAVHAIKYPVALVAAVSIETQNQNALFGFVKNTGDGVYLSSGTLSNLALRVSRAAPFAFPVGTPPQHSAPLGSRNVVYGQAGGGFIRVRQGDLAEQVAYSPIAQPIADGTVVPGCVFGVNISGQTGADGPGVPNAAQSGTFAGGAIAFGDHSIDREVSTARFSKNIELEMRPTDYIEAQHGDSLGDGVLTETGTTAGEVFESYIAAVVVPAFPTDSIYGRNYCINGQGFTGWKPYQIGTSGVRRFFHNASIAGAEPSYSIADRFDAIFGGLPHLNVRVTQHGHNMTTYGADVRGLYIESENALRAAFPATPSIFIREPPALANNAIDVALASQDAVAAMFGDIHVIDIHAYWIANGRPPAWFQDGLHHTSTGVLLGDRPPYDAGRAAFVAPAQVAPPRLGATRANAVVNGDFMDFDGAVPTGWALYGPGAVRKSPVLDPLSRLPYSVELEQVAGQAATYLRQTGSAVPFQGQTIALLVRERSDATGNLGNGVIRLSTNGTGGSTTENGHSRNANGVFRDRILLRDVPADATTWTLDLFASSGAGVALSRYSAACLVVGTVPKRLAT